MNAAETLSKTEFQHRIAHLNDELYKRDEKIQHLEEQLAWFKRQIFGKRSERVVTDLNSQQLILEGFENLQTSAEEQEKNVPAHTRRKPNRNGQDKITLPPDLPVQTTILDIPEEEKYCKELELVGNFFRNG